MSSSPDTRSPLVRFLDSFLQEQNIKWMLGLGMLILLGSSLRLVGAHWDEYTPVWKYATLLAYTGAIFVAGRVSYFRLGLHRTGTMLMSLTVLLVPITFLTLHWIRPSEDLSLSGLGRQAGLMALLGLNLVLSARATHSIFLHFLRKPQPTFQVAYLTLCLAGAIVPGLPAAWSPAVALCLWAVFTVGTIKVNRHVFWLVEEHRQPRVFGFFPIALLGAQFLTLFVVVLRQHIALPWCGLACVLIAVPIVLTADTVASVFRQRTGELLRPLPWSVVLPVLVGVLLCAAGIGLAATDWPTPFALVPTATLAAVVFACVAQRTERRGFVWLMLVCTLLAYQFSPLFFRSLALSIVQQGAVAVNESKLPIAFYGLTYLPFLAVLSGRAGWLAHRGQPLFAAPCRQFASGVGAVLLVAAFGHAKAVFPACLALTALFIAQVFLFRQRRLLTFASLALIGAAWGCPAFLEGVLSWRLPAEGPVLSLALAAIVLYFPGLILDRLSATFSPASKTGKQPTAICQTFSLGTTLPLAGYWLLRTIFDNGWTPAWYVNFAIAALLVLHTLRCLSPLLGEVTVIYLTATFVLQSLAWGVSRSWDNVVLLGTIGLFTHWLTGTIAATRFPQTRFSRALACPMRRVGMAGLIAVAACHVLPNLTLATIGLEPLSWPAAALVTAWCVAAAAKERNRSLPVLIFVLSLLEASAAFVQYAGLPRGHEWILALWAAVTVLVLALQRVIERTTDHSPAEVTPHTPWQDVFAPLGALLPLVCFFLPVVALLFLGWPHRLASAVALGGLLLAGNRRGDASLRQFALPLANWNLVSLLVHFLSPQCANVFELTAGDVVTFALPVAGLCAVSLLLIDVCARLFPAWSCEDLDVHRVVLRVATFGLLVVPLEHFARRLPAWDVALATVAFAALAAGHLVRACQTRRAAHVWWAEVLCLIAVGYLALFGVIEFGSGLSMYVTLVAGLVLHVAGELTSRNARTDILARPFSTTGFWLPLAAVALGVVRFIEHPAGGWKGMNSLALLFAAAFYFWRGLECRSKPLFVLSTLIVNVALALLWGELRWSDPQLFMIPIGISVLGLTELLLAEIPARLHDPLRYLGALVILVSPTFEILDGSWIHLFTLMLASVSIALMAIGLRIRALMYAGTAFLLADLVALVVRGSIDQPNFLWMAGIVLGMGVVALGAICESHREGLLSRLRMVAAELETWR